MNAFDVMPCPQCCSRPRQQKSTIIAIASFVCFLSRDMNNKLILFICLDIVIYFDNLGMNVNKKKILHRMLCLCLDV